MRRRAVPSGWGKMQRRVGSLLLALLVVQGLGGCISTASKPTPPPSAEVEPAPMIDSANLIFVVPVSGLEGPSSIVLADAVAASLRDTLQPAILAARPNDKGPTIAGRIVRIEDRGSVMWLIVTWELLTPYGTAVAEYVQEIVVDREMWRKGAAEAVNLVVSDAAPNILRMVADHVGPMPIVEAAPEPAAEPLAPPPEPELEPVPTTVAPPPQPAPEPEPKQAAAVDLEPPSVEINDRALARKIHEGVPPRPYNPL